MTRPLRIEFPGAIYHVTSRGNARQVIFEDDEDRQSFLDTLTRVAERFNWICHAYCLMDNHYHLMIETPDGNLSTGMRQLNGVYTQRFNRRYGRVGHVMQGRFKSILVERDSYLLELCRYIVLNPVRARMVRHPEKYLWSSYRSTAGLNAPPALLSIDWILGQFGKQKKHAGQRYQEFVLEGIGQPSPWGKLKGQILLGSDQFIEKMHSLFNTVEEVKEIPKQQRLLNRPSLDRLLLKTGDKVQRNSAIREAHIKHLYSLSEIGRFVGLHYTTVSKIASADHEKL